MTRCGCNPVLEPFEFPIVESLKGPTNARIIPKLFSSTKNLEELKDKIICEYMKIIDKLECGIKEDLEFLLEEISLVDILENG